MTHHPSFGRSPLLSVGIIGLISWSSQAVAESTMPTLTVSDTLMNTASLEVQAKDELPYSPVDTANMLKQVPGANVNRNGSLTGIAQYRGLFGDQVKVQVDGMDVVAGCSNQMDPPLHFAPVGLVDKVEVYRGIAPVSLGLETFGGYFNAERYRFGFAESADWVNEGHAEIAGYDASDAYQASAVTGFATDKLRYQFGFSKANGDDYEFDGGTVSASEYDVIAYNTELGTIIGEHEITLGYSRDEAQDTGTPALPMDIEDSDADRYFVEHTTKLAGGDYRMNLSLMDVYHKMNNFDLRPVGANFRRSIGNAYNFSYDFSWATAYQNGTLTFGLDGQDTHYDSDISDPTNDAFWVDLYENAEKDINGIYVEWDGNISENTQMLAGIRANQVTMDADEVSGMPAMMNPNAQTLRDEFNAADRSENDTNIDLTLNFRQMISDEMDLVYGFAHKTRSPSYQQKFLWMPMESTSGLADGNTYMGNLDLDPEKSIEAELGVDWDLSSGKYYLSPRLFYRHINDYIQGVPETDAEALALGADLRWDNVDAKLYGLDMQWEAELSDKWQLAGIVSYTRGKRRDISDDLYRIAPLNATTTLTYQRDKWSASIESVLYDAQDDVSEANSEEKTSGYGIVNLYGRYTLNNGLFNNDLLIRAGIDNLADKRYLDHLGGYNRVSDSDVAVGERLPGVGRNVYLNASYSW